MGVWNKQYTQMGLFSSCSMKGPYKCNIQHTVGRPDANINIVKVFEVERTRTRLRRGMETLMRQRKI